MQTQTSRNLLLTGVCYLLFTVTVIVGYGKGIIGHALFSPSEALGGLMVCSLLLLCLTPCVWWFKFRGSVNGKMVIVFIAFVGAALSLILIALWFALAAV